ncbi:MAG: hypothetical protein IKI56_09795 [Ruminococcus sp.]|nr:hypothetical protein [Ruminococcus sp.]
MSSKNKNILIAVLSAVIVLLFVIIGVLVSRGGDADKGASSSASSDIIDSGHFQDAEENITTASEVQTTEKIKTVTTTASYEKDTVTTTKKSKKNKKNKTTTVPTETAAVTTATTAVQDTEYVEYRFRNYKLLDQHFEKHGGEFRDDFGYETAEEYEKGASDVINNPDALYKTEAEDGDGVYYLEATNEFVILSTDGYIRTYFRPNGGIDYFNRQ